jgi:hypothetical protein
MCVYYRHFVGNARGFDCFGMRLILLEINLKENPDVND